MRNLVTLTDAKKKEPKKVCGKVQQLISPAIEMLPCIKSIASV